MDRLKLAEMLGFFYGISDKYPKVTRFIKEIADYLYAPISCGEVKVDLEENDG